MIEAGVAATRPTLWFALMAPPGLPAAIATRLNRRGGRYPHSADMKETLARRDSFRNPHARSRSPTRFAATIEKWKKSTEGGIKAE